MKLNKKTYQVAYGIVITLFLITLSYLSLPYIEYGRTQYSSLLELQGDLEEINSRKALINFRKAELISPRESLYLKIGRIYDNNGNHDYAERYFNKIKSEDITLDLVKHHLRKGDKSQSEALLSTLPSSDESLYYKALILTLESPQKALEVIQGSSSAKNIELAEYLIQVKDNGNNDYKETAIAIYLYNNNFKRLAVSLLEPIVEVGEYNSALEVLGDIYYTDELYRKAATAYEGYIKNDPYEITIYYKLVDTYENLNDKEKVEKYNKALKDLTI